MNKKILVIDDDIGARKTLYYSLSKYGYKVIEAAGGKEGIDKAQKERPDLVLVDTLMPDMNGNEVCRQIKGTKGLNTKIIVFTGFIDAVDAEKARAAGADDYVVKTSKLQHLLEAAKKLI